MSLAIRLFFALPTASEPPTWIHLVPAGTFRGADGRGPYNLDDAAAVIELSMRAGKLPLDENHAIDLAAVKGQPSPARGWIVALEARADGIWGRVEWTPTGQTLMTEQAYRGISPALLTEEKTGRVVAVVRASLTNAPNLNLTSLHQRSQDMDLLEKLRAALGLASDATEDAVLAGVTAARTELATHAAQIEAIAIAAGLDKALKPVDLVVQLQAAKTTGGDVAALRATVVTLQSQLETLQTSTAKADAERFIDDAIKAGKVGLKPLRDHYIARHMADAAGVAKEIAAMPSIHGGGLTLPRDPAADPATSLNADEQRICELMNISPEAYLKSRSDLKLEAV